MQGLAKGDAIKSRLGYDISNWKEFREDVIKNASKYPTEFKDNNGFRDMYEQRQILYGKKVTPSNVVLGWSVEEESTIMTSAYIKEVK